MAPAPVLPRRGRGSARSNFGLPPPARLACQSPSARPPRALTLAPRTRLPPAPPRHAHRAPRPPPRPEAAARIPGRARPVPSRRPGRSACGSAAARVPVQLERGGQSPRARGHRAQSWEGWGGRRWLAPGCTPSARAGGRGAQRARGAGRRGARGGAGPGGSPTRGSCCLNAGALPSRRSPRPAQPRPPGAPVPFVPGRCSGPRERRDWSARMQPPSRTHARRQTHRGGARTRQVRTFNRGCALRLLGVRGQLPNSTGPGQTRHRPRDLPIARSARRGRPARAPGVAERGGALTWGPRGRG